MRRYKKEHFNDSTTFRVPRQYLPQSHGAVYFCPAGGGAGDRLLDDCPRPRDIADPWYTGNFDVTYDDIVEGCEALLDRLEREGKT